MREADIQRDIMAFLSRLPGGYFREIVIDSRGRRSKGVLDIIGVYRSTPYAIEVKKPDGVVSDEQEEFMRCWTRAGGIAFVARSVRDVIDRFHTEVT